MFGGCLGLRCLRGGFRLGSLRLGQRHAPLRLGQFIALLALDGEDAGIFGALRRLPRKGDHHGHAGFMAVSYTHLDVYKRQA